jgi:hypothetical protein
MRQATSTTPGVGQGLEAFEPDGSVRRFPAPISAALVGEAEIQPLCPLSVVEHDDALAHAFVDQLLT